ncbi:hypothetical protein G6011_05632 [Alternaria panax]|uniref:WD40 repeat-like protein n=1 Tax=Alternaria panax TaxID=48097 RepID=A0AAD4FDS2_9PLEO|nr:hypothetical protein G6011_05632 [Alternaria panax]
MKNPQRLPFEQSLFVATPNAIHSRTQLAHETLFECETANGIVNARASKDNRSLFAVADGQVVILHDATRVKDRKYKLKSGDSEPRLLLFSPDSRTLYFTTTLNNSVQAYSIPNDKILPSLPSHPSPPNAIAVSSNGTVLLSASPNPPTIYLQDQRWARSAPVDFRPTDACYPVTCAAFQKLHSLSQPSYTNFVIGFQDGSLAMYRLFLPPLRKWPDDLRTNESQFFQLQPVRIGVIKKLHKPAMSGVLAAEFIAGYKSRVVSIRHDGKCRLVDFGGGGKVLRTWNISCPATCLSVSAKGPVHSKGRVGEMVLLGDDAAEDAGDAYEGSETLIAIGTRAGKVLVFNVLGLLIHEIAVGISVTAVEWIGDMTAPSVLPTRATSLSPKHRSVVDVVDTEQSTPSEDEGSTVKKFTSLYKPAVTRKPVPVRPPPGLFSDESRKFKMKVPSRRASDVLKGSPPRGERARNRPLKKSSVQPRISTEMVQSPPNPLLQDAFCVGVAESLPKPNSTIQESRRWHQSTFKTLDTRADSSSSVYSRSISGVAGAANHVDAGAIEDTDQSASSSNLLNPLLPYQHQLGIHVLGTPLSTSSPSRLYSPATPSMFCDGLYAVDGPSVEKAKEVGSDIVNDEARTAAEETACLAKDQRALRKEFEALREEYRVLKHVLLKPKTEVAA